MSYNPHATVSLKAKREGAALGLKELGVMVVVGGVVCEGEVEVGVLVAPLASVGAVVVAGVGKELGGVELGEVVHEHATPREAKARRQVGIQVAPCDDDDELVEEYGARHP